MTTPVSLLDELDKLYGGIPEADGDYAIGYDDAKAAALRIVSDRLPVYEAVAVALERLLKAVGPRGGYHLIVPNEIPEAHAALGRLRGQA